MSQLPFARPGQVDYPLFDRFSAAHALVGAVMERYGASATTAAALAIGWEVVEDALNSTLPASFPYRTKETFDNRVGDVIGVLAGWGISRTVSSLSSKRLAGGKP